MAMWLEALQEIGNAKDVTMVVHYQEQETADSVTLSLEVRKVEP
jgi:hypothetical protein